MRLLKTIDQLNEGRGRLSILVNVKQAGFYQILEKLMECRHETRTGVEPGGGQGLAMMIFTGLSGLEMSVIFNWLLCVCPDALYLYIYHLNIVREIGCRTV